VDGTIFFDVEKDKELRKQIAAERNRLIRKMIAEGKSGSPVVPAKPSPTVILTCGDHDRRLGLLETGDDLENN
jgi:hypothetical protein